MKRHDQIGALCVWMGVMVLASREGAARAEPPPEGPKGSSSGARPGSPPVTQAASASGATSAAPSRTQPAPTATATVTEEGASDDPTAAAARSAHLRGLDARETGDWAAARSAFAEAWAHKRHWEIAVNLGEAEIRTGRYEDALSHFAFALEEPGFLERSEELVRAEKRTIEAWMAQARSELEAGRARRPATGERAPLSTTWLASMATGITVTTAGIVTSALLFADAASKVNGVEAAARSLPGQPGDPAAVRCAGEAAELCGINRDRLRAADTMESAGAIVLTTAGLVAAAAVLYAVLGAPRDVRPSRAGASAGAPWIAPAGGNGAFGLALVGSW